MDNDQVGPAVNAAREALRAHFRAKRIDDTKTVVQEWRDEHVYPFAGDPLDAGEIAEQALFNFVAVGAAEAGNAIDRKSVVVGKRGYERVESGGRRTIHDKKRRQL